MSQIFATTLLGLLVQQTLCFCPPLLAPQTTTMTCLEPVKHQLINCSTSWLPEGTVALFTCRKSLRARAKGKIVCSDDGIHRHETADPDSDSFPCGIYRDPGKPEIHIFGFQSATHYSMANLSNTDFRVVGELLHNDYRKMHQVPPLKLNDSLCGLAQSWANKVAKHGRIDMASDLPFGQNIFLAETGDNLTSAVNDAVNNWYLNGASEYCWEDVTDNWTNSLSLAFSQVIWKNSSSLGIGAAPMKWGNRTAVIAFYDPSGNVIIDEDEDKSIELFNANVLPKWQTL